MSMNPRNSVLLFLSVKKSQLISGFHFQSREHLYGAVTNVRAAVPLNRLSGGCPHMARGTLKSLYARLSRTCSELQRLPED
jgi:hypothetical protein